MSNLLKAIMKHSCKALYELNDLEQEEYERGLIEFKHKVRKDSAPQEKIYKSMKVQKVHCKGGVFYRAIHRKYRSNKVVIFIHGGGFFLEALNLHWEFCARLAERTGCEIIFPEYPLVPESDCIGAHEMLMDMYQKVFAKYPAKDITIMGDSAGGTLALSTSIVARDKGLPLAKEIVLISPGFVVECDNEQDERRLEEIKKHDFIIGQFPIGRIAKLWNGTNENKLDESKKDVTKLSVEGLPRITMFSGTHEIMNLPARKYYKKLKACHHPCCYIERIGGLHDYALLPGFKKEFELIASRVMGN